MNMKKLMAGVVASAMAVSMMAVGTSAKTYEGYALIGVNWGDPVAEANGVVLEGNWNGAALGLPEDVLEAVGGDYSLVTFTFTAVVDDIDADAKAQIEANGEGTVLNDMIAVWFCPDGLPARSGLAQMTVQEGDSADGYASTYSKSITGEKLNTKEDGTFYSQVQNGAVTKVTWTITYTAEISGEGEGDPEPGAGPTEGPGSDPNKDPVDSGIEGVALVAGLAIVAAGAVVVAKKRG